MEDIEEENALLKDKIKMLEELAVSANGRLVVLCVFVCLFVCLFWHLDESVVLFSRCLNRI